VRQPVTHSLVKALRAVPDFDSLEDHTLLDIVGASVNLFWPAGTRVFEKGSPSEALYVVLSGEIRIVDTVEGREQEVSRLGPGESFGELSLLLQTTHTKNAEAVQDSELMVIPEESFQALMHSNEELSAHFRRRVEERIPLRGEVSDTSEV
jgi:CRP-like cAMP-binding protein